MKIGFYLSHPAHFHLFKNIIKDLRQRHDVFVVYNKKDVLHNLIADSDFANISSEIKTKVKVSSKAGLLIQFSLKVLGAYRIFRKQKADVIVGTSIIIAMLGKLLHFKSIIVNEDDFDIVKKTADFGYPYADTILAPSVCRTTHFDKKTVKYEGYHELAYLHPNHFTPDKSVVEKYFPANQTYYIIRFVKLAAHHDEGIKGINSKIATEIVRILSPYGKVFITSERKLEPELEGYRININPIDMHHVMAFAALYIGDSQTMAAEAGVLGVPFIRFNDFVGRISYLNELENKYELGYGIKTENVPDLYTTIRKLTETSGIKELFQERRKRMMAEKIDVSLFMSWFIENYPQSLEMVTQNPSYPDKFK
jgi:predicted glycosyltransferase